MKLCEAINILRNKKISISFLISFLCIAFVSGQIRIPSARYHDAWSQPFYDDILESYVKIGAKDAISATEFAALATLFRMRLQSMYIIGSPVAYNQIAVRNFINIDSKFFIKGKYPILAISNLYSGQSMFKNIAINFRFGQKFQEEVENTDMYLGKRKPGALDYLYISEAERIRLTLEALKKVILISLENEKY